MSFWNINHTDIDAFSNEKNTSKSKYNGEAISLPITETEVDNGISGEQNEFYGWE